MKVPKMLKNMMSNKMVLVLGAVIALYLLYSYSQGKMVSLSGMSDSDNVAMKAAQMSGYEPANPLGQNSQNAPANGLSTNVSGMPPSCANKDVVDPKELLPRDSNSEFAKLNPMGAGDLKQVNFLKAGHHIGIDTVGQSLRNANLQLRSEPANPKMDTGPWNNSTISGDQMRRPMEIGN
jgi:hypothetical protein